MHYLQSNQHALYHYYLEGLLVEVDLLKVVVVVMVMRVTMWEGSAFLLPLLFSVSFFFLPQTHHYSSFSFLFFCLLILVLLHLFSILRIPF